MADQTPNITRSMQSNSTAWRITDEAESLIRSLGYNGFSYEDVARAVGIRKPSIHHHFSSKANLGAVVVKRYTSRFEEALINIDNNNEEPLSKLMAYADLFEQTYSLGRGLCVCGILSAEAESLSKEINEQVRHFFEINLEWLKKVFAQGQAKGSLTKRCQPSELAQAYLSMLEGTLIVARALHSANSPRHSAKVWLSGFEILNV
jgi:TetR/AcrR family transcriptional repressor of nem operon